MDQSAPLQLKQGTCWFGFLDIFATGMLMIGECACAWGSVIE